MDEEEEILEDGFHMVDDMDIDDDGEPIAGISPEDNEDYDPDSRFT